MTIVFFTFAQMNAGIFNDFVSGRMDVFYAEFYPALIIYASKILGPDYSYLAEDCVQESVYKTYQRRDSIAGEPALKSYLYSSVRNNAISILRKGNSKANYLKQIEMSEQDIHNQIIEQETLRRLFVAIDRLPESSRQILDMSFREGLHNRQIAEALNISESTVKRQKSFILKSLQESIKDNRALSVSVVISIFTNLMPS